ncbi:MAG: hypothetical protein H7A47_13905 [Verrucomicrobiales bacterium]|nr:hypothetical protein [Verrucomicrobiales bacterium]
MTKIRTATRSAAWFCLALGGAPFLLHGQGAVVFTDDFDTDTATQWSVLNGSGNGTPDYTAAFHHDYSAEGIPPAPNTSGGTTRGLKFTVNNNDDVTDTAAVNAYPGNNNRSGDHGIRFDMWLNYNGGAYGGIGSTEFGIFGLNHAGTRVNWANDTYVDSDGVWFAVTGEGGASRDYRAYEGFPFTPSLEFQNLDGGFFDRDGDGLYEFEVNPNQAATFPLKEFFPAPDYESPGAPGKHWVQVELRTINEEVTWVINGYIIARRPNLSGSYSGTPMLGYMDVFSSIADPREENFVIYDNFRVVDYSAGALPTELAVEAADPQGAEPGDDTASFRISRLGSTAGALTVHYRLGGTATPGADFESLPGTVEIPAGADSVTVTVQPRNDLAGEGDETVTLSLVGRPGEYEVGPLFRAEVTIADDGDTTGVSLALLDGQTYERMPEDEMTIRITREGSTEADLSVNLTYAGTAGNGDYDGAMRGVTIPAGAETVDLILAPVDDVEVEGEETIEVSLVAGPDYNLGEPATVTAILRDDDQPEAPVLFSDNFDTDTAGQWHLQFGSATGLDDFAAEFAYDYGFDGIPPAPGAGQTTKGLRLRVNKFDAEAATAGINAYPNGQSFSGSFALRYNLYLSYDSSVGGTTEHSIAGINHSGEVVNRHGAPGGDGLWFAIETDGSASGGRSYAAYTGDPSAAPAFEALPASQFVDYFTAPPFLASGAPSGQWVDVEIAQVGTKVTLTINGVKVLERTNDSAFTAGDVMVGHMDTYSSIGSEAGNYTLIDNLRVVQLEGRNESVIDSIVLADGKVVIEWTGTATLQSADTVSGPWSDVPGATSPHQAPPDGPAKFYRLNQ